jgi:hypothetical protein
MEELNSIFIQMKKFQFWQILQRKGIIFQQVNKKKILE